MRHRSERGKKRKRSGCEEGIRPANKKQCVMFLLPTAASIRVDGKEEDVVIGKVDESGVELNSPEKEV